MPTGSRSAPPPPAAAGASVRSAVLRNVALVGGGAIAGAAAVAFFGPRSPAPRVRAPSPPEIRRGAIGLVNPLLECREATSLRTLIVPFRGEIDALLAKRIAQGAATRASVYYRDLNNGPWFAAGDPGNYRVASLLKVPLLIGYLKRAETEPDVLEKRLRYDAAADPGERQNVLPEQHLQVGRSYTVWELLEAAVVYSDNEAAAIVAQDDGGRSLEMVRRLADFPPFRDGNLYLTPRNFAAMFRILYNASFLDITMSERALALLVRTAFRRGLVAGVPDGIPVANKFGEREDDGIVQLHDCGIVYHPAKPYVLCVMSEGRRFDDLAALIADVSRLAYDEVSKRAAIPPTLQ